MQNGKSYRRLWLAAAGLALVAAAATALAAEKPKRNPPAKIQRAVAATAQEACDELATSLAAAIDDLAATFGPRYPGGPQFLRRLQQLRSQPGPVDPARLDDLRRLQREALLANPLVCGQPLLFVVRPQYKPDHHNTETMFQTGEINTEKFQGPGAVKSVDFAHGGRVRTLLEVPDGVARDLELSFDGRTILFALRRNRDDDYHLYTIRTDGSGLRQLTFGSGITDIDPIWLPNGQILFTSTREPKYCMCNRHIMGNLFVMEADGSNLQQIGHSTLHEGHAALLDDGRVIYDRWEYVDRNFGDAQGLWTVNPDGTNHAVYYGNNTNSPGAVLEARPIPGTDRVIVNFSSCHDRPWGALAVLDRRRGLDLGEAVVWIWPPEARALIGRGNYDTFRNLAVKYEDPYPLSEKYFLCSRMTGHGDETALCLLDVFGNELLIYEESPGCFDPLPLKSRPCPPAVPARVDLRQSEGTFYVADVYRGTGMETVERGSVRRLRVVESPEKRFWTHTNWQGSGTQAPGMAWDDFNNKRILGTVPVESDGSAYFTVPADTFVYFQLLDERGLMLQSMRSGAIVRPGEAAGCVGCHDERRASVPVGPGKEALARGPQRLQPWYGPPRNFSYLAEVQPVFDRHCAACHDFGQAAGRKLNLAGDLNLIFNTSYCELRGKKYVKVVGAGPSTVQLPKSWGAHASRLTKYLLDGHGDPQIDRQVHLDREAIDRVLTWIDINAPYYPDYSTPYRDNLYGRSPLDHAQLERLSELTGRRLLTQPFAAEVIFGRPELSPCLAELRDHDPSGYAEALAIVRAGSDLLARVPRTDMPGYRLAAEEEIRQQQKYESRREVERQMRAAIINGQRRRDGE